MGYTSLVMPRLRMSLLAVVLLFMSISIRADDDISRSVKSISSRAPYKKCDYTVFNSDNKIPKLYENIFVFWPAEYWSYQDEIQTANVQNLIVDIINTGTIKKDALVTFVVDYVDEVNFTNKRAGSPMYSFIVNDVCKAINTDSRVRTAYNPFTFLSNGIFEFLRTRKSNSDNYANRYFPRPKSKVVDTISLMINFLSTLEYSRSEYDYEYGYALLETFFRNHSNGQRGPSEYVSPFYSFYNNAIFVPIFHGANYFTLFDKVNTGNVHNSHNNLINMGFYDNKGYEEIDMNIYSRNNGFLFHRGVSITDPSSQPPLDYDKVGPMWCPNVNYTGKYDNNRFKYSTTNKDILEKVFVKSDRDNYGTIKADRFKHIKRQKPKVIKDFEYVESGVYSPLNHMINVFNESKNILGAVEDITYKQCFDSGAASVLASDLIAGFRPSKIINYSIGRFKNPWSHSPYHRNYDISQTSLLRIGCPSIVGKPDSLIKEFGDAMCASGDNNHDKHDTAFCFSFDNAYATAVETFKHATTNIVSNVDRRAFNVYVDESSLENNIIIDNGALQKSLLSYLSDVSNPMSADESKRFDSLFPNHLQNYKLLIDPHNICYKSNGRTYKPSKVY